MVFVLQDTNFAGDIGGILGLFLGFSVMTAFEFVELAVDLLILFILWLKHRSKWQKWGWERPKSSASGSERP